MVQQVEGPAAEKAILGAIKSGAKALLGQRQQNRWRSHRSRLLALEGRRILLERPVPADGSADAAQQLSGELTLTFRLHSKWYLLSARVASPQPRASGGQAGADGLIVEFFGELTAIERRYHRRVDVPASLGVRAVFWPGGLELKERAIDHFPQMVAWTGTVCDLGLTGVGVRAHSGALHLISRGDLVGVRIALGPDEPFIWADGALRNVTHDGPEMAVYGIEFWGMQRTPAGRESLKLLSAKVEEYQAM